MTGNFVTRLSTFTLCATLLTACGYDNGSGYRYVDPNQDPNQGDPVIYSADIDTDATLENVVPGEGVGMMIEYFAGGTWRVQFTCDTAVTDLQCYWSINAQSLDGSSIGGVDVQHLDPDDAIDRPYPDVIWYDGLNTTELDRFTFQADPGKPIGFDVYLDGEPEPNRYVFWISDGWLNRGISGASFDLYPKTP